jgi:processive 1,2-diacylglycerol beta-glucosyltransferase
VKALILHASAGAGHRRAAEALAAAFHAEAPSAKIIVSDILEFTPRVFKETYAEGYLQLVRRIPELWGYMYSHSDKSAPKPWRKKVRATFNKINMTIFFNYLRDTAPDIAICTHFLPLEVLSTRAGKKKLDIPFYAVVTDFAVHSLWIVDNVSGYYVASDESARQVVRRGQPAGLVKAFGIPVDPVFSTATPLPQAKKKLGLRPDVPVVLILSGGRGVGSMPDMIQSFEGSGANCQLLAVAGTNEQLKADAERAAAESSLPVKVFGFVDNVHELMDAADLIISKPGGLTTSELLAKGKPMVITAPIPGQEQRNCEHLLEAGVAVRLYEVDDTPYKVSSLLDAPDRLKQMCSNARAIGRPHAARDIVMDIMALQT